MGIFQEDTIHHYTDTMTMRGFDFVADIGVSPDRGSASAIHGGRIVIFELMCDGETVAYFENGTWYQMPMRDFDEAYLAMELLIEKWRKYTPRKEDKMIFVRGGIT